MQLVRYRPDAPARGDNSTVVDLSDYDVLPSTLRASLASADHVEIADPLSFPFEDAGPELWDLPLLVRLPDLGVDDCLHLFDQPLLRRLTVCDQLAAPTPLVGPLVERYGFSRSMFVASGHQPIVEDLETAARVADELQARRSVPYPEWPLPASSYKRRLVRLDQVVREAVAGAPVPGGGRPRIELHGWNVRRLVPSAWGDLVRVVERRPIALERLGLDYPQPRFNLDGPGSPVRPLGTDVGVGVDHLRQASEQAIVRSLQSLFESVQVGGRLLLLETFDSGCSPGEFVDILLDISTHRLILQDLQIVAADNHEVSTTALFVLNKIGARVPA